MGVNFDGFFIVEKNIPNYYRLLFNSTFKAILKIVNSIFSNF